MEDSRLLSLLDQYTTAKDDKFPEVCSELVALAKKHLAAADETSPDEQQQAQLREYLAKRLLDGSTSDEARIQDRLVFRDEELRQHFDSKATFEQMNGICSTSNAIKKSEKKYFAYSHVANLLNFYLSSRVIKFDDVKELFEGFLEDTKDSVYFVAGFLASATDLAQNKGVAEKLKALVEAALSKKIALDSYRQASFYLTLQNLVKALKLKIENSKFESLESTCQAIVSPKSIGKYFEDIILDDALNTSFSVPFFSQVCSNVLERSSDKALPKLFRFFQATLVNVAKDKSQRQKRSFHLVSFFRAFVQAASPQTLLGLDIDSVLEKGQKEEQDSASIADIFVELVDFWIKQFSNKNQDSKKGAIELDHVIASKIKSLDSPTANKLTIMFLKTMKNAPTNSLRGGDLRLMNTLLGLLYKDEQAFRTYFGFLTARLKKAQRVAELNFYLNELEHFGQVSLTAKGHKDLDQEKEATMRCTILQALIEVFINSETEQTLASYLGREQKIDWNEQDLSFKKFRTKSFERILNLVFKREDPDLLRSAADLYSKLAGGKSQEAKGFFDLVISSANKISSLRPKLADLLRALIFQNVFEEDLPRNAEIVKDITTACLIMSESSKKRDADVIVDSLIALCTTTHPQLKHIITGAMESFSDQITRVGFSLLFQAVVRVDSKYLEEDEDEDGEAMEEESLGAEEEEEEPVLGSLAAHEDPAEESAASRDETEALGKRKENGKSQPKQGKANGQAPAQAPKPQAKPGEQPTKQKKTS